MAMMTGSRAFLSVDAVLAHHLEAVEAPHRGQSIMGATEVKERWDEALKESGGVSDKMVRMIDHVIFLVDHTHLISSTLFTPVGRGQLSSFGTSDTQSLILVLGIVVLGRRD